MRPVVPENSDEPSIKIMAFESTAEVAQYMSGDDTVLPKEETIISGGNAEKQT